MFRGALERRRCLVHADAFYEWRAMPDGKQPYAIGRKDGGPLAFAGVGGLAGTGRRNPTELRHWRWCTWRLEVEIAPNPRLLCDDRRATDGIGASGRQHPVQHCPADGRLGLLGSEATGSKTGPDQRLVATHCRFH